jgi:1,2-phenylacetyl-CoA epoxidase catalytic subunit
MSPRCGPRAYSLEHLRGGAAQPKSDLVSLAQWAVTTGRGWLVRAVGAALQREGLCHV